MLNEELMKINQPLELVCAGGYVMQFHGFRSTVDVDAFYNSNAQIDEIIRKVGDSFGINRPDEVWLNNSIWSKNPMPPAQYCEEIYKFSHLAVSNVNMFYLIGMKLESGREQDLKDVATVIKSDKNIQPLTLHSKLSTMNFNADISMLLEAFGIIYGLDWLTKFYTDNETELQKFY
jgi:hypothetical protein